MTTDTLKDQARAIREQHEKLPEPRKETAREGRYRRQREEAEAEAKKNPHRSY